MKIETVEKSGVTVAVVTEGTAIIDATSAMELAMTVRYETGCSRIAIDKKQVCGDFFILSTQLAGEVLQKFINYRVKMAIYAIIPTTPASRCMISSTNPIRAMTFSSWRRRRRHWKSSPPPDKTLDRAWNS